MRVSSNEVFSTLKQLLRPRSGPSKSSTYPNNGGERTASSLLSKYRKKELNLYLKLLEIEKGDCA